MNNLYQHFRENEKAFVDQALDWARQAGDRYAPYLTPFLDPRQVQIIESIVGQEDELSYVTDRAYDGSERKRVLIYPNFMDENQFAFKDFKISLLEIIYPKKFTSLSHGQILGSLMGLGIKRDILGDIVNDEKSGRWQFYIDTKMVVFLKNHLTKMGSTPIELQEIEDTSLIIHREVEWSEDVVISSSLRLDTFLSSAVNLSREKAKTAINNNRIKVNWQEIDRPDFEINQGDVVSIAKLGRIKVINLQGKTKKDKYIIEIGRLNRNQ